MRLGLLLSALMAPAIAGCGESSSPPPAPALPAGHPPAPGPQHAGSGPGAVFALSKVFVGDVDRDGSPDEKNGWRQFGFNIDGVDTTCVGQDCGRHCRPRSHGSASFAFPDGDNGIDNGFGLNLVPLFEGIHIGSSHGVDEQIARGELTLLIAIDDLGSDANDNPLPARMYEGAPLGMRPKFDGSDVWPIARDWLDDPSDIKSAKFQFPASWLTNQTWVSGHGDLSLYVNFLSQRLTLNLHHAIVAMDLSTSRQSASGGVISAILDPDDFATQFRLIAGSFDKSLCRGNTIDSIVNQIEQSADIMIDGRVGDESETCNGISVGLGFEAARVELGGVVDDPAPTDPCKK